MITIEYPLRLFKMSNFQQFLYVLVKEDYADTKKQKNDTILHIVHWKANAKFEYEDHFIIYGKRPTSKISGEFTPYRLKCNTKEQIYQFVKTVVSPENSMSIELHQFYGYNDDSEDWYNIDWENTAENSSTEIVAFDVPSKPGFDTDLYINCNVVLSNLLNVIANHDIV